jgi:amino acid transporter
MKPIILGLVTLILIFIFVKIYRKKDSIVYFGGGRWWLTWLSLAIITLMDELTSIFYAPAEAFRFIGIGAIFFIIITSLFIRFASTRMVEIAQILEINGIKGGGVYSFSYIVLGPTASFIAVASILVDYILTACISTVSAVENGMTFFHIAETTKFLICFLIVWGVAGLNIIGIKENARFTYIIFIFAGIILLNLIVSGLFSLDSPGIEQISNSFTNSFQNLTGNGLFKGYGFLVFGIASCILAYSGIESVVQTAGLVKDWKEIRKSYIFLALTVGIVTPLITLLALSSKIKFEDHTGDLIPYYSTLLNGPLFGFIVGMLASVTLIMAVNTAYVASSELLEKVAERYNFNWIIKTNKRQSLYRIHIANAIFYSLLIIITNGSQDMLAQMYALGLIASFTINMGCLLIYRYFQGTGEIKAYFTSRVGTLIVFILFLSCFIYLILHKPYGAIMWASVTTVFLFIGFGIARKRAPEKKEIKQTDSKMDLVFAFAENPELEHHIYFLQPDESKLQHIEQNSVFITFYNPRERIPVKSSPTHFRFPLIGNKLLSNIYAIIELIKYELPGIKLKFHFGWPSSSWIDRLSIGVMVFEIMKLPKKYPEYDFVIEHFPKSLSKSTTQAG